MTLFYKFQSEKLYDFFILAMIALIPTLGEISVPLIMVVSLFQLFRWPISFPKLVKCIGAIWLAYFVYFLTRGLLSYDRTGLLDTISRIIPFIAYLPLLFHLSSKSNLITERNISNAAIFGSFLLGYGVIRFSIEFLREADAFFITNENPYGYVVQVIPGIGISMGQLLTVPMIVFGFFMILLVSKRTPHEN